MNQNDETQAWKLPMTFLFVAFNFVLVWNFLDVTRQERQLASALQRIDRLESQIKTMEADYKRQKEVESVMLLPNRGQKL